MCRSDKVWCVKGVKSRDERFTAHPTVSASLADRNHAFDHKDLNLFKIKSKNQNTGLFGDLLHIQLSAPL